MQDLLPTLHHYRSARSRLGVGRGDDADRTTALTFGRLLGNDPPWHGVDPVATRRANGHPVTIALPMGFAPGTIARLTGAGVLVATDGESRPGLGTRCVVRIDDAQHSYLFPAVVSMAEDARPGELALLFDGPCDVTDARRMPPWKGSPAPTRRRSRMPPAA